MIRLSRKKPPPWIRGKEFQAMRSELFKFYFAGGERGRVKGIQQWPKRQWQFMEKAEEWLIANYGAKCWYSEESLGSQTAPESPTISEGDDGFLTFHRPPGDATDAKGNSSPEHYWFLVTEWTNWYLASRLVQRAKGVRFPVIGPRMPVPTSIGSRPSQLDKGQLIDPVRDRPAFHLRFLRSGRLEPRGLPFETQEESGVSLERAKLTIRLLDLNDQRLIDSRRTAARRFHAGLKGLGHGGFSQEVFLENLRADSEFAGVKRQYLAGWLAGSGIKLPRYPRAAVNSESLALVRDELVAELMGRRSPRSRRARAFGRLRDHLHPEDIELLDRHFTVPAKAKPRRAIQTVTAEEPALHIERGDRLKYVKIRNFKAIHELDFEISPATLTLPARYGVDGDTDIDSIGWRTFLGENGSGKSAILQAVGLALAGGHLQEEAFRKRLQLDWNELLRRGETHGRIFLRFTGPKELDLRFNANKSWWVGPTPEVNIFVRGYGATRLLNTDPDYDTAAKLRIDNLYSPLHPVGNVLPWLLSLPKEDFRVAATALTSFLGIDLAAGSEPIVTRNKSKKSILVNGDPLSEVSDGYRAVIAMACDIMAGLGEGLSTMRHATGIVLVDEIGAHLHPSWRMAITPAIRRALPEIQFLVSTHEPLCLRGLGAGEVLRVRKNKPKGIWCEEVERSPQAYRVDQLLTSEFFGLDTTVDRDDARRYDVYYQLLAMDPALRKTKKLEQEFLDLQAWVNAQSSPVLGNSRRDQLAYKAIDKFLARDPQDDPKLRQRERRKTIESVRDLWKQRSAVWKKRTKP